MKETARAPYRRCGDEMMRAMLYEAAQSMLVHSTFGLTLKANRGKGDPAAVTKRMLERTGLARFHAQRPAELSGGMRQRAPA